MERIEPITHSGRESPATTSADVKRHIFKIVPHGTKKEVYHGFKHQGTEKGTGEHLPAFH